MPVEACVGMSEAGDPAAIRAPHCPQNRVVSGLSAEQRAHVAIDELNFSIARSCFKREQTLRWKPAAA